MWGLDFFCKLESVVKKDGEFIPLSRKEIESLFKNTSSFFHDEYGYTFRDIELDEFRPFIKSLNTHYEIKEFLEIPHIKSYYKYFK